MAVGCERKTRNVTISPENTKTDNFNQRRALSGSFSVISERLVSSMP